MVFNQDNDQSSNENNSINNASNNQASNNNQNNNTSNNDNQKLTANQNKNNSNSLKENQNNTNKNEKSQNDDGDDKKFIYKFTILIIKILYKLILFIPTWIIFIIIGIVIIILTFFSAFDEMCFVAHIPQNFKFSVTPKDLKDWVNTGFVAINNDTLSLKIDGEIFLNHSFKIVDSEIKSIRMPNLNDSNLIDGMFTIGKKTSSIKNITQNDSNSSNWENNIDLINGFLVNDGDEIEILIPIDNDLSNDCQNTANLGSNCDRYNPFIMEMNDCNCTRDTKSINPKNASEFDRKMLTSKDSWIQDDSIFRNILLQNLSSHNKHLYNYQYHQYKVPSYKAQLGCIGPNDININNINNADLTAKNNSQFEFYWLYLDYNKPLCSEEIVDDFQKYQKEIVNKYNQQQNYVQTSYSKQQRDPNNLYQYYLITYRLGNNAYEEHVLDFLTKFLHSDDEFFPIDTLRLKINTIKKEKKVDFVKILFSKESIQNQLNNKITNLLQSDARVNGNRIWTQKNFNYSQEYNLANEINCENETDFITKTKNLIKKQFNCEEKFIQYYTSRFSVNNYEIAKNICTTNDQKDFVQISDDLFNKKSWFKNGYGLIYGFETEIIDKFLSNSEIINLKNTTDYGNLQNKDIYKKFYYLTPKKDDSKTNNKEIFINGKKYFSNKIKIDKEKLNGKGQGIFTISLFASGNRLVNGGYTIYVRHNNLHFINGQRQNLNTTNGKGIFNSIDTLLNDKIIILDNHGKLKNLPSTTGAIKAAFSYEKPSNDNNSKFLTNIGSNKVISDIKMEEGKTLWIKMDNYDENMEMSGKYNFSFANSDTSSTYDFQEIIEYFEKNFNSIIGSFFSKEFSFKDTKSGVFSKNSNIFSDIIMISLIFYIMIYGIMFSFGKIAISLEDFLIRIAKILLVLGVINQYTLTFLQETIYPFLNSIYEIIVNEFVPQTKLIFTWIDKIGGLKILFLKLGAMLMTLGFGTAYFFIIGSCIILLIIYTCQIVAMVILSKINLMILISFAPIFITLILFERTKNITLSWIGYLLGYALEPIFIIISISFIFPICIYYLIDILSFSPCIKAFVTVDFVILKFNLYSLGIWGSAINSENLNNAFSDDMFSNASLNVATGNMFFIQKLPSLLGFILSIFILIKIYESMTSISKAIFSIQTLNPDDMKNNNNVQNSIKSIMQLGKNIDIKRSAIKQLLANKFSNTSSNDQKTSENKIDIASNRDNSVIENNNNSNDRNNTAINNDSRFDNRNENINNDRNIE